MTQLSTYFAALVTNSITPISCPNCASNAHLVRRSPATTGEVKGEIRTFECSDCKALTETFIPD